jgi:hypothetical protein
MTLGALLIESWPPNAHYAAPVLCVVVLIALYGLRMASTWKPRNLPLGQMMVRAAVILVFCWTAVTTIARITDPYHIFDTERYPSELERARLQAQLEATPGEHLVLVHIRRSFIPTTDWVYNEPDIDHAKVVWARDMGTEDNEELLRYFKDRRVWIVDMSDGIHRLTAYDGHSSEDTLASAVGLAAVSKTSR